MPASLQVRLKVDHMYDAYQTWALKTYGDSAKTKTVTRKKYNRIMMILKGEESSSVENSKFRFWVKAKGFKIRPIEDVLGDTDESMDIGSSDDRDILYVLCSKSTVSIQCASECECEFECEIEEKRVDARTQSLLE